MPHQMEQHASDRVYTTSIVSQGVELPWPLFSERSSTLTPPLQPTKPSTEQLLMQKQEFDLRRASVASIQTAPTIEATRRPSSSLAIPLWQPNRESQPSASVELHQDV